MLIHVVGYTQNVVFLAKIGYHLDLVLLVHLPEWIVWVIEYDGFGFWIEQ